MIRGLAFLGIALLGFAVVGQLTLASAASLSFTSQALTPSRTCTITAAQTTTTAVIDAEARQGSASTNFGSTATASVASGSGVNQRIHLKFDLTVCSPTIPSSAVVRLATLRLYVTAVPAACRTLDLFRIAPAWTETAITWSNQPFGTTLNNPPTGSRTGSFSIGTPVGCQNQVAGTYINGGVVTSDLAAFVAGSHPNLGWMIRDDTENSATTRTATFSTKELGSIAQEPQLIVTYVTVP